MKEVWGTLIMFCFLALLQALLEPYIRFKHFFKQLQMILQ